MKEVKQPSDREANNELRKQMAKLQKANQEMSTELQKIFAFANDRNVQIYAQAYYAAITAGNPLPGETAAQCLGDLHAAFGIQKPATVN